jgi:UDP-N-acetylglucosamine:LPS N-acetylglucosamine transferase
MKWLRSNIRHGARVALFALAVQFVLSFGHFHGVPAQAAPAIQSAQQQLPASNHDSDQQPGDSCAICAVIALANAVLFATPPVLLPPQAVELLGVATDAEFVHLNPARVVFQPRAPPTLLTSMV